MALVDLLTNLENFKYEQTSPDKIDAQIEKGVDFFDDIEGGAAGFTPKVGSLESQYHKYIEGPIVAPRDHTGTYYSNLNPFENRKSTWRTNSGKYRFMRRGTNPPSVAYNDSIFYPPFPGGMGGQTTLYDIDGYTINVQPGGFSINNPQYPDAVGNSLLPEPNLFDFTVFRGRSRTFDIDNRTPTFLFPFHSSPNAPFMNIPLPGLFSPNYDVETRDLWQAGSINIFDGDTQEPIGGQVSQFADLGIGTRTSQFSSPETFNATNIYTLPEGFSGTQTTLSLPKESFRYSTTDTTDTFQSTLSSGLGELTLEQKYLKDDTGWDVKDLFNFTKSRKDTFTHVPAGLNENNVPSFGTYREVADPINENQPFILRPVGSNWDNVLTETPGFGGAMGGLVAGALGVIGLLTRTSVGLADKARIFKYMVSPNGISFIAKQFAFQALNPTIESKIYNPLSTLGIAGSNELLEGELSGLLSAAGSFLFPTHVERHFGIKMFSNHRSGRYIDALELTGTTGGELDGRIAKLAEAFAPNVEAPEVDTGLSFLDNFVNGAVDAAAGGIIFASGNPNKYAFPISSAPKSVTPEGISFIAGPLEAVSDFQNIKDKSGGTFNPETAVSDSDEGIYRHHTLAYDKIPSPVNRPIEDTDKDYRYMQIDDKVVSPSELYALDKDDPNESKPKEVTLSARKDGVEKSRATGVYLNYDKSNENRFGISDNILGNIRRDADASGGPKYFSDNVDKVNMIPYGSVPVNSNQLPAIQTTVDLDFIKFRFKDMVNNKWIIFRATLEAISDTITPEYGEERYIGRPDHVYVYQGTTRNVSFGFSIYPKTKQELPVLMEKLNYLVGLCYPSYTESERMITPFISLTIGDLFVEAPGLLESLAITVEDEGTWELDEGLQFPHYIKAQCEFKYIGNNVLASKGKHYGLNWIPDGSSENRWGGNDLGFDNFPNRNFGAKKSGIDMKPMFVDLGQVDEVKASPPKEGD